MADSFFGFDTSLGAALDDGLDCLDDEEFEENNYDALNDETFGSEAVAEDWEQDHEKLSRITESSRHKLRNDISKSESEIDVEKSLSHLVLDEKEITIPRPGVWDSPTNFPIPPPQILPPKPSLSTALKNAPTVEELERGFIANRPPPGLIKQPVSHPPPQTPSGANLFLNSIGSVDKLNQQINGVGPPHPNHNQFSLPIHHPLNQVRLPPKFFVPNVQPMLNQPGNLMRCPIRPHLWPSGVQRPPLHGNFPPNNLPHPINPSMGPYPFMRSDHPLIQPYGNNHQPMQHNMLMGNQRNQNNKFIHNDRQDNLQQPFFWNNQFLHQNQMNRFYNNQGYQGHAHMANHHHNHMNGIGLYSEQDEYAGLMNNREKQWLNNIQLLQLNTNQPYIDDYYYTVFCDRLNKKNENRDNAKKPYNSKNSGNNNNNNNNNNNGFHRDSRDKEQPTFTKAATTPMQFENSLGKLQYSSVTAPRKIIDMDVVPNSDPLLAPSAQQKDTKKTRQLLLEIERLYILLLKLEDKNNPLAVLADQQREQQLKEQQQQQQESGEPIPEPEVKDPVKEKEELITTLMSSLVQLVQEDKFASLLSIRKGKTLFHRLLPCIDVKDDSGRLSLLWKAVIKNLAIIGRRDSHLLINFYTEFQKWMDANSTYLINLAKEFTDSFNQPSKTNSLTFALTNKFGISVIGLMLKQIISQNIDNDLVNESSSENWARFLQAVIDSIGNNTPIVAPCDLLNVDILRTGLRLNGFDSDAHLQTLELFFTEANPTR